MGALQVHPPAVVQPRAPEPAPVQLRELAPRLPAAARGLDELAFGEVQGDQGAFLFPLGRRELAHLKVQRPFGRIGTGSVLEPASTAELFNERGGTNGAGHVYHVLRP